MFEGGKRYPQIDKEALAVIWACQRFQDFLIGKIFQIEMDHKRLPLLGGKDFDIVPARVQGLRIPLMRFSYDLNYVADA